MGLEHLWAGWRLAYVEAADDVAPPGDEAGGSVFTRILHSGLADRETHIVWRGEHCFAILNAFPYTNGHLLVMPYREVGDLVDLTGSETAELWRAVTDATVAVRRAYRPDGVNLGANLGRSAGAGIPGHLHVHVLPRWSGDTNFMTTVAGTRVMPETLESSAERLRVAWPRGDRQP